MNKVTVFMIVTVIATISISYSLFFEEVNDVVTEKVLNIKPDVALEAKKDFCIEYVAIGGKVDNQKVPFGSCSKNKPAYCKDSVIISNCGLCGCNYDETCSSNGECVGIEALGAGGGVPAEEGAVEEEAVKEEGQQQQGGCTDSDASTSPSPIYQSSICTDETGSYGDDCTDPGNGQPSTVWVKEYKCAPAGEKTLCMAEFKNCPSNTQIYYGTTNSVCGAGACSIPETCSDSILNQDETDIDCGGSVCPVCPTCSDGIQNQDETDIDCGGSVCPVCPTCSDGIQNQGETGIDCGGPCTSCGQPETCSDGILNQDETGIDCGGVCPPCGGGPSSCTTQPLDSEGLTIFTDTVCSDSTGDYYNSCNSPVGGEASTTYIKTHTCISDRCATKYYSCPVMGETYFGITTYVCSGGYCTP